MLTNMKKMSGILHIVRVYVLGTKSNYMVSRTVTVYTVLPFCNSYQNKT